MVKLLQENIVALDCDCIVNAANERLRAGGGVCGAIHAAAGYMLQKECDKVAPCPTGSARITKGYDLKAKWVIHAVGPVYRGKESDAEQLASCYRESLDLAKEYAVKSIAFPAISTGIFGYPLRQATEIAVRTVEKWLKENAEYGLEVIFCCYDSGTYDTYRAVLNG